MAAATHGYDGLLRELLLCLAGFSGDVFVEAQRCGGLSCCNLPDRGWKRVHVLFYNVRKSVPSSPYMHLRMRGARRARSLHALDAQACMHMDFSPMPV